MHKDETSTYKKILNRNDRNSEVTKNVHRKYRDSAKVRNEIGQLHVQSTDLFFPRSRIYTLLRLWEWGGVISGKPAWRVVEGDLE
jgi:hypothetical protein